MRARGDWGKRARYAWATFLALAILGLTYVVFDPDLGTSAPLFGEFSCKGKLEVEVANGFHEEHLTPPASGLYFRATGGGRDIPALVTIQVREGTDGAWQTLLRFDDETGEGAVTIPSVTERTQAIVHVKDRAGDWCESSSRVISARAAEPA